jgi:hypothetical protein
MPDNLLLLSYPTVYTAVQTSLVERIGWTPPLPSCTNSSVKKSLNISSGVSGIGTVGPTDECPVKSWIVGATNLDDQACDTLDVASCDWDVDGVSTVSDVFPGIADTLDTP